MFVDSLHAIPAGLIAMAMIPLVAAAGIVQMSMMTGGYGDKDVSAVSVLNPFPPLSRNIADWALGTYVDLGGTDADITVSPTMYW